MKRVMLVVAVISVAGVLGWGLASPHVQEQPPLAIPLYERAQIDWTVHLTAQELSQKFTEWVQGLSVLTVAGYRIEGERTGEVLNFYDQQLSGWRQLLWMQPSESGGARIFAQGRAYLSVIASKQYEETDVVIATAQADEAPLEVPIVEGAELQWQLVLTKDDLLEILKRWFQELVTDPPTTPLRLAPPGDSSLGFLVWLGWLGVDAISQLLRDFSELNIIGYRVEGAKALEVLTFYEQKFNGWRRNLWIKPEESGSVRLFSRSDEQGLAELAAVIAEGFQDTTVIVLYARR